MAKKTVVFDLKTNTGNSVKDMQAMSKEALTIKQRMDEIEDATRNISKATRESDATTNMEKLNRVVDENVLGWQEMGQAVDTYRNIARAAGTESPVGQEALRNAAELEREMENLQTEITSLSSRGREMQAALQLGTGIVAGYSAFQGVVAMLGVENEKMLETITKLQAAQSTLMGIEQIRLALERDSILMVQARIVATRAQTVATNLLSRATAGATVAAKAFNVAMSAGIIGAITAAIALLVAKWDDITEALGLAKSEEQKLTDQYLSNADERIASINDEVAARQKEFDMLIRRRQVEGASEAEISALRGERTDAAIEGYEKELALLDQAISRKEGLIQILKEEGRETEFFQNDLDKLQESRLLIADELNKIELERLENMQKAQDSIVEMQTERKQKEQEVVDSVRQAADEEFQIEQEKMSEIRNLRLQMYGTELEQLKAKHHDEREALIEKYGADTELLMLLEQQQRAAVDEFKATKDAEELEKRKALLLQLRELEANDAELARIAAEEQFYADQELLEELREMELLSKSEFDAKWEKLEDDHKKNLTQITRREAEKQKAIESQKYSEMAASAQSYVQSAGSFLSDLNTLASNLSKDTTRNTEREAKRQFAIDKAVAIAQATIKGALGIVQTIGTLGFPAAIPFVALSAAITGASIAAIASEKFQGAGGGGGGGGSFSPPSVSVPAGAGSGGQGESRVLTEGEAEDTLDNPPTSSGSGQVVVLASDVQDVNNQNDQIDAVSTIGGG